MKSRKVKYGISLSGGGARGFAHLGVLTALEESGIYPEIIAGCSMGSVIGAYYAAGYSPSEMLALVKKEKLYNLFKWKFPKEGMLSLNILKERMIEHIPHDSFSALKIPFYVAVSNISKGEGEIISSGSLHQAVMASSSVPIIFDPQVINGDYYVDGALYDDMPVDPLVGHCDKIIASHVNYNGPVKELNGIKSIAERVYRLAIYQHVKKNFAKFDIIINPPDLRNHGVFDFKHLDAIVEIGYQETMKAIKTPGGRLKSALLLPETDYLK
jgi:NTE family protein